MYKGVKERNKTEIITRLKDMDLAHTAVPMLDLVDEENSMIPFILVSKDNAGERYDWFSDELYIEELDVNGADLSRLKTFFRDHVRNTYTASGRISDARVENGQILMNVFFGSDEESQILMRKYIEGVLTEVSAGYRVNDVVITNNSDEPTHVMVTDYEIFEASAVWRGFDPGGAVIGRSEAEAEVVETPLLNIRERELKILGEMI